MNLQLVYRHILSLSKNDNMFYEKKNKTKQNKSPPLPLPPPKKKRKRKFLPARVEPGTIDVWSERVIYEILPVDTVWSR